MDLSDIGTVVALNLREDYAVNHPCTVSMVCRTIALSTYAGYEQGERNRTIIARLG
jgi:hypothetical protein